MIIASAIIGGAPPAYGVTSDGSDELSLTGGPSGIVDAKTGLLSFWIKASPHATNAYVMAGGHLGRFSALIAPADDKFYITCLGTGGGTVLAMNSSSAFMDDAWHHVLAAWDTATAASCKVYLDNSDVTALPTRVNNVIDYAAGDMFIGTNFAGDMAELYFSTEWLDLTSLSNREAFARNGRPAALGADGSGPTGTAPIVYMRGPASNWGTNAGTGGDFSVTGTFTDAATRPSY